MPINSSMPQKVHRLGIVFTATGTRFLSCKDCTLSIEIDDGSDASVTTLQNRARSVPCIKTPNAFSSDWGSRRAVS
jgi:hypothetical protein